MSLNDLREFYENMVGEPGPYEGEARYVPYLALNCEPDAHGRYRPDADVRQLFPELRRARWVRLACREDMSVREVGRR